MSKSCIFFKFSAFNTIYQFRVRWFTYTYNNQTCSSSQIWRISLSPILQSSYEKLFEKFESSTRKCACMFVWMACVYGYECTIYVK